MKPTFDMNLAFQEGRFEHFSSEGGYVLAVVGTLRGMTPEQIIAFAAMLSDKMPSTLIHGCCMGVDEHADKCYRLMLTVLHGKKIDHEYWKGHIHGYPPTDSVRMMSAINPRFIHLEKPKRDLIRCKKMVNNSDALLAFPDSPIRFNHPMMIEAHKKAIPLLLILPSGAFATYPFELL